MVVLYPLSPEGPSHGAFSSLILIYDGEYPVASAKNNGVVEGACEGRVFPLPSFICTTGTNLSGIEESCPCSRPWAGAVNLPGYASCFSMAATGHFFTQSPQDMQVTCEIV
jgi:hypothetical protein